MAQITAVYPGTFDPITLGHEDLLRRAARMFDRVIVAVAIAHHKKTMFSLDERMDMAREALADCPQVQVEPFEGLVTEFTAARGGTAMVRGLRSGTDFDYEFQLAGMNRALVPQIETVFLTPRQPVPVHQQHPGARDRPAGRRRGAVCLARRAAAPAGPGGQGIKKRHL